MTGHKEPGRQDATSPPSRAGSLPAAARTYVILVAAGALAAVLSLLSQLRLDQHELLVFALLALGAAFGSSLIVSTERNHGFNTALVFIAAAVMLLPPPLIALMGLAQYAPELIRRRYPWYTQLFNLTNWTLNALAAWGAAHLVAQAVPGQHQLGSAFGAATACLLLVSSNHLLLAGALRLARARSLRETGLFSWKSLSTELLLASLGVTVAAVWSWNPYLLPLAIAPFALISRSFLLLEQLQQSERRFRAIYESTAMGIRLTDTDGVVVGHNRAFGDLLGSSDGELAGKGLAEFTLADETGDALFAELVDGSRDSYAIERKYRRSDGELVWVHLTASLVRDADGNPEFTVGMVHDVSDRKQLEERLHQAEKLDAVGRLAGGVAHDFNNLLTVITVHSGFLLGSLDEREVRQRADVGAIAQAAERAAELTQRLLAFGRKQLLQPRIVDLNTIVVDTNKMLHRLIGDHIEVVTALGPDLWDVQADPGQIEQVLVNLALNARDAMSERGTLTIRTANADSQHAPAEAAAGDFVVLTVRDSGCGMDAATRARIFDPFFTTKESAGTGLGLASVYGIVAQSGGFIDVTSLPGEGTTMAVYLPRVVREHPDLTTPVALPTRPTGGETVLLVDDEDGVRGVARRVLAAQGYTVLEAFDGAEALALAAGHNGSIDLLVTDVVMPRKTGPQVAAELLALRPELRVLFMSGHADKGVVPFTLAGTDTAFVQKPFTNDGLAAAARELLDRDAEPVGRAVGAHPDR
jgi:PAS domain S-box-containing protein